MAKKKSIETETEVESTEVEVVQQPEQKKSGKWVAKMNVICGKGVALKKGDEIPQELVEELKAEGFAEQV